MLRFAWRMPGAALRWRQAFRAHRPDLIHVHCFGPNGTYGRVLAARTRTPLVITSHGETLADDTGLFSRSRFAIDSLRTGLAAATAVTGCSRVAIEDLEERFGLAQGRGVVVYNGIDLDEPGDDAGAPEEGRLIAAVGRLQRLKGFDLLVEAFSRADLPQDVRLVIGGDGPERDALRDLAERLGVGSRVTLPGRLGRPAVVSLRRRADIGVVSSRSEPFGIAVLEIWRAGRALIATTHGGPPEFVRDGETGLLVDPLDTERLAGALRGLIDDPARAAALGAAGAEAVRSFTWDRTVDGYEAVYAELARDSARGRGR